MRVKTRFIGSYRENGSLNESQSESNKNYSHLMKTLGQIRVVTLVEMDEDLRKFSLISTRILSSDEFSETVRLSTRFILENYDPVKVQ